MTTNTGWSASSGSRRNNLAVALLAVAFVGLQDRFPGFYRHLGGHVIGRVRLGELDVRVRAYVFHPFRFAADGHQILHGIDVDRTHRYRLRQPATALDDGQVLAVDRAGRRRDPVEDPGEEPRWLDGTIATALGISRATVYRVLADDSGN